MWGTLQYNMKQIKVFGDNAKEISQGDKFIAKVDSVEGRTVVTLVRVEMK
jgi:hypothetical protein